MDFPNYFNTLITIVTYNPKDDLEGKYSGILGLLIK